MVDEMNEVVGGAPEGAAVPGTGSLVEPGSVEAEEASDAAEGAVTAGELRASLSASSAGQDTAGGTAEPAAPVEQHPSIADIEAAIAEGKHVVIGTDGKATITDAPPAYEPPETVLQPDPEGHADPLDNFEPYRSYDDPYPGEGGMSADLHRSIAADEMAAFHEALADWHKEMDALFAPAKSLGGQLTPDVVKHALLRTINFLSGGLLDRPPPASPVEVTPGEDSRPVPTADGQSIDGVPHTENAVVQPGDHVSFDVPTTPPEESTTLDAPPPEAAV